MKAILISGSFKKIEIEQNIIDFINDNLKKDLKISFIVADFNDYESNDKFTHKLLNVFKEKDLLFKNVYLIDNRCNNKDMINKIEQSNIIFLLGGDTLKQIKNINDNELKKYICNEDKIIIGMSAGAINMAKRVVLAKDIEDNIPKLSIYNGLGITNINIEPHCDFYNKEHWKDLLEASMYTNLIVMHDDTYIIINNEDIKYYGHYLELKNKEIYYRGYKCELEDFILELNNIENY